MLAVLILLFLPTSFSIFITMENRRHYCFYKSLNLTENLEISYVISGVGQK